MYQLPLESAQIKNNRIGLLLTFLEIGQMEGFRDDMVSLKNPFIMA